jgi:hypothetical protein
MDRVEIVRVFSPHPHRVLVPVSSLSLAKTQIPEIVGKLNSSLVYASKRAINRTLKGIFLADSKREQDTEQ